ncbi:MAG: hypothetical protein WCV93_05825 [Candidatus Shapirobacteria bacterium]|jgi:flagellar biogenesis protein FliO
MEINQILSAGVLLALGTLFAALAFFIFSIYADVKSILVKTNSILDDTKQITNSVAGPVTSASKLIMVIKSALATLNALFGPKRLRKP